jgi:carboxypeptidase Q
MRGKLSFKKRVRGVAISFCIVCAAGNLPSMYAQPNTATSGEYDSLAVRIAATALEQNNAIGLLTGLCTGIGSRLSGSPQAAKAVEWAKRIMNEYGFQSVHTEPVMVPHWVRGPLETASYSVAGKKGKSNLHICALGGSIGTPQRGVTAEIIEVKSWQELRLRRASVKGKIVFFDRPMDRALINPGTAYGRAVDQRTYGAIEAAKEGAVAVLVRSMSTRIDNVPHTGMMKYDSSVTKIPSAAVSTGDADALSKLVTEGKRVLVTLRLSCQQFPDVESANVIGEIAGSEKPDEVIVVGAHLDSWDKGQGAHDDGAGCAHVLEALRLIKELGLKPKRTIRAVLFMNEENGLRGGLAYEAGMRAGERHIAAIESDAGGFSPCGFSVSDSLALLKLQSYAPVFRPIGADHIVRGGEGGADIGPLKKKGVVCLGLQVDGQKYFDYHHSDSDTIDKVNERELELGASAVAAMAYIIAEEGL